jgi:O-antigen/teichoic acid export membrane protein
VGFVIMMTGRTVINLVNNVIVFIMIVVLNSLLIPKFGLLGAAASLAIALGLVNIIRLVEVYLILKIHPYRVAYYKPFLAGALAAAASWALKHFWGPGVGSPLPRLAAHSSIIALVYLLALLGFGINEEEKLIWRRVRGKLTGRAA